MFNKMTGFAPEEYTRVRYRSSLRRLKSFPTEVTIKIVSRFGAINCSPLPFPGLPRERQALLEGYLQLCVSPFLAGIVKRQNPLLQVACQFSEGLGKPHLLLNIQESKFHRPFCAWMILFQLHKALYKQKMLIELFDPIREKIIHRMMSLVLNIIIVSSNKLSIKRNKSLDFYYCINPSNQEYILVRDCRKRKK